MTSASVDLGGHNLQHTLRKSSSDAVVVPSSSNSRTQAAMDCSWLSSSAGSGVGGVGFLSGGLETSASASEIGGRISSGSAAISSDIRQHLQSMFHVLRPEETLKMVSTGADWNSMGGGLEVRFIKLSGVVVGLLGENKQRGSKWLELFANDRRMVLT